jgi:hypothetical protein
MLHEELRSTITLGRDSPAGALAAERQQVFPEGRSCPDAVLLQFKRFNQYRRYKWAGKQLDKALRGGGFCPGYISCIRRVRHLAWLTKCIDYAPVEP